MDDQRGEEVVEVGVREGGEEGRDVRCDYGHKLLDSKTLMDVVCHVVADEIKGSEGILLLEL